MSEFRIDQIYCKDASRGPDVAGITTFTGTSGIVMPSGDTAYRGGRGRGVFGGGYGSSPHPTLNTMDYVTIATLGNALDFGDLTVRRSSKPGGSSATRGCFIAGRFSPTADSYNVIDYITISSTGNAFDFGDLIHNSNPDQKGTSNQIRTVYAGGYNLPGTPAEDFVTTMGYFTIATLGNSSDFGNLSEKGRVTFQGSNGTRGIFAGRRVVNDRINTIEYVNIMTTGDALDFGDLTVARSNSAGSMTSSTRMVMQGGLAPSYNNTIDYITMASLGDAINFGDTGSGDEASVSTSNSVRGIFTPGTSASGDTIEYITIATLGDAADFGNLSAGRRTYGTVSDSHGGLG